jgi:ribosomal protein S27E
MFDLMARRSLSKQKEKNDMYFYDFQCQGCGWDMERLVSRYVIEIKCPICGCMSQKQMAETKKEI